MLDKQIQLFKLDTNAFFNESERNKYVEIYEYIKPYQEQFKDIDKKKNILEKAKDTDSEEYKNIVGEWNKLKSKINLNKKELKKFILDSANNLVDYNDKARDGNKHIRELSERYLSYVTDDGKSHINLSNVVSMFESTLSRSFGIATDELTYDIFIVEIYYYPIAKDIIKNGFDYNGKHYVYFSSSAGQIRTKKAVFVEEEKFKACQMKLMCGLTVDEINRRGGMNINKYLAYTALSNSATELWENVFGKPFDIDKAIVVDDFETLVNCQVDDINIETYEITPGVWKEIPIPHTDGCGMISADYCSKNFMVRLPFIKGLLGSFDYKKFIKETDGASSKVKDIWGKEYDIIEDDIQVIFTKSQLKMYKYYDSWDQYKEYFKQYECEAGICNLEEDYISDAKFNYQMLQTLYDMTNDEIKELCAYPNKRIKEISNGLDNALSFFGVKLDCTDDSKKDWFQKSLRIYPELLNDPANKQDLHDLKKSMVKKYRGSHLDIKGKFTFVLPDLYAFCEWLFCGIEKPLGLLENGEVFCKLYARKEKLDCLRSPHLYIEHAIRLNKYNKKYRNQLLKDWFTTAAIYTSTYDPISRILQFDVDGDRLLVLSQERLIERAEKQMQGIYPLYYEMKKANAELITPDNIYKGLELAFTGGRIGGISNDITKIWNSGNITDDALKAVKWLCLETNFTIDYAKTLFKPTRPKYADDIIKSYTRANVPYFFKYAKDKTDEQIEECNDSLCNKITKEIKENKNMFKPIKNLHKIDYLMFLKDKQDIYSNKEINKVFDVWNKKYGHNLVIDETDLDKNNIVQIANAVKNELHAIEPDDDKIINSLVRMLYKSPSTRKKKLFWYLYGEQLYNNLLANVPAEQVCHFCGKRTDEHLINGKCFYCRKDEYKKTKQKLIKCCDCGCDVVLLPRQRTERCEECRKQERKRINQLHYQKIKTNS